MENKDIFKTKEDATLAERNDLLVEQGQEVLADYQDGDSLLVIRLRDLGDGHHTRAVSGIVSEHLPALKQLFEQIIQQNLESVAEQSPFTAARLMAKIMTQDD